LNAPTQRAEQSALTIQPPQFDLSPRTFDEALEFAKYLAASEMVPKIYRGKPGDCLIAMQWGYEVGMKPLQALQSIATINGKPGVFGDAGKALLLQHGCEIDEDDTEVVKRNGKARCKITRPGRRPVERTFSLEDAKTAGLWGKEGPWRTYPFRQMAWRAFWFAARDAAADILRGLPGLEEVGDAPAERHMGAADVVQPTPGAAPSPAAATTAGSTIEWSDDALQAKLPKMKEALANGKTHDELIAFYGAKATLTPAQLQTIRSLPLPAQTQQQAASDAPVFTYAAVAHALQTAEDAAQFENARDMIRSVADPQHRAELEAIADKRESGAK
jgi:hypothetical protein